MLSEILKAFREADGPLDLNELGRRLGIEKSALEGMLETLVRQGKLREVNVGAAGLLSLRRTPELRPYLKSGNLMGKVYELKL